MQFSTEFILLMYTNMEMNMTLSIRYGWNRFKMKSYIYTASGIPGYQTNVQGICIGHICFE